MNKSNAKHLKSKDKIESINALVSFSLANKLFDKQPDGSFEIEKYNTKSLEKAVQRTTNASGLFDYISKHGNEKGILKLVNENALMKKINSKYTLLDYVLSNQIIPYVLTDGKGSLLFAEFLRERGLYKYLVHFKTEILLHKFYGNKTLLDELNERGYNNKIKTNVTKEDELIKLIESSNLSTINHISNRILLSPAKNIFKKDSFGNETVLEHLVDTGYDSFLNNIDSFNEEIIITLCLRCYYKLLGDKVSMRKLINTKIKGRSVLDFILKSGTSFEKEINSLSLAQKVLNSGRIDLLVNCSPKILYEYATLNETYLEYLLDAVKSNKVRCNLKKIRLLHTGKINDLVNFYMALAQKDLCDYVNPLNEKDLLTKKNGKRLIDELLRVNRNLTIDKILTHKVKTSPKIAAILKSKGIVQKGIQLPVIRNDYSGDDLDKIRKEINNLQIPEEGEKLLFDLEQAFLTGEKSSYDLIQALICGYRRALYVDYNHSAQEIKKLIEIKINNPEFAYRMRSGRSCFRSGSKTIFCENNNITILMHETGHALHYFLTDFKEPNEFEEIVKNVRENPDTIKKVDLFYKNIGEIKKKLVIV